MDKKEFLELGKERGYIGLPCSDFFTDTSDLELEFVGPIGDVIARCYWSDASGHGGCISVPKLSLAVEHAVNDFFQLEIVKKRRRQIEDKFRKSKAFFKAVSRLYEDFETCDGGEYFFTQEKYKDGKKKLGPEFLSHPGN